MLEQPAEGHRRRRVRPAQRRPRPGRRPSTRTAPASGPARRAASRPRRPSSTARESWCPGRCPRSCAGMLSSVPDVLLPDCVRIGGSMMPDASPTARALLALELVQGSPGITADRLADKLGVSERAARRYVGILREAGIPDRVRPRAVRRLPPRPRPAAAAADVHRHRGPRPGHGRARRPPRRERSHRPGRQRARQDHAGTPGAGGRPGRGGPADHGSRPRPRRRPARPRDHDRTRAGLLQPPAGAARLPLRGRIGVGHRGRPVGGRRPPRPVVPAVPVPSPRTPGGRTGSTGSAAWSCSTTPSAHPPTSTRSPCSRSISPSAGSTTSRSSSTRPLDRVARCLPRALGRLEPLDAQTSRLVGSTSNPWWYAEQLAAIPASYRIVRCPELQECARVVGRRLLDAGENLHL